MLRATLVAAAAMGLLPVNASAARIMDGIPAFRSGSWTVYRSVDPMTDATKCTAVYDGSSSVQLDSSTLYIVVDGGLRFVQLRFGDQPAQALRETTPTEQELDSIVLQGYDLERAMQYGRIRVLASTAIAGSVTRDIDTSGAPAALESIRASCPGKITLEPRKKR